MYEDMSYFEINKKLANALGYKVERKHLQLLDCWAMWKYGTAWVELADYCNSWSDIGPLIERYWEDLMEEDEFGITCWDQIKSSYNVGAAKAAAICILKKLESER